jgi:hypothetical protein
MSRKLSMRFEIQPMSTKDSFRWNQERRYNG